VHRTYGIGKFLGFEKITVEGTTKEYVKLEYANSSYLYVPTTNLDVIEKYIGTDDVPAKTVKAWVTRVAETETKGKKIS